MIPKEWRDYSWQIRPFVVLGWLIYSPAVVLPLLWLWSLPWESPNAPAWVQAVGSIAAILTAIGVARHQTQIQVRAAEQLKAEQLEKIVTAARYAGQVLVNLQTYVNAISRDREVLRQFAMSLDECSQISRQVKFLDLPGTDVSLGWLELHRCILEVRGIFRADYTVDGYAPITLSTCIESARRAVKRIEVGAGYDDLPVLIPWG